MRARIAVLLATVSGCSLATSGLDTGLSAAPTGVAAPAREMDVVLRSYGVPASSPGGPPYVRWVAGEEECQWQAWRDGQRCLRGMFDPKFPDIIIVATWEGALLPQTSFAHEVLHWLLWREGIDSSNHGGEFYVYVARANDALWAIQK